MPVRSSNSAKYLRRYSWNGSENAAPRIVVPANFDLAWPSTAGARNRIAAPAPPKNAERRDKPVLVAMALSPRIILLVKHEHSDCGLQAAGSRYGRLVCYGLPRMSLSADGPLT